jgi:ferredoxin
VPEPGTFVVTGRCVDCRYTFCVVECPVTCFWGLSDPPMVVIDPTTCLFCDACVPVCPRHAIWPEEQLPPEYAEWKAFNAENWSRGVNLVAKQDPLSTAGKLADVQGEERGKGWAIREPRVPGWDGAS